MIKLFNIQQNKENNTIEADYTFNREPLVYHIIVDLETKEIVSLDVPKGGSQFTAGQPRQELVNYFAKLSQEECEGEFFHSWN